VTTRQPTERLRQRRAEGSIIGAPNPGGQMIWSRKEKMGEPVTVGGAAGRRVRPLSTAVGYWCLSEIYAPPHREKQRKRISASVWQHLSAL